MKRKKAWARFIAAFLAAIMLLTDQSVASAVEISQEITESETEDSVTSEKKEAEVSEQKDTVQEETLPEASGEENPDKNGSEKVVSETDNQKKVQSEKKDDKIADVKNNEEADKKSSADKSNEKSSQSNKKNAQKKITDKKSGVNLIYASDQLPEDVKIHVDEIKETEDKDYPEAASEKIGTELSKKGFALEDIVFYDIDLGGAQPSGNIQVKLPVPKSWDGELDAWYIDENGNVTYMDRETEDTEGYYTFQTDHFSLYAVSVSNRKEESASAPKAAKSAPRSNTYSTIQEMAEAYYGENATDPQPVGTVSVTRYDSKGSTVLAGDVLTLRVSYTLDAAPTFDYGNGALSIFDTYNDTKIKLKLPEGMSVTKADGDGTLTGVGTYEPDSSEENTWILTLDNHSINASSSTTGSFTVNLLIEGNGELEIGKVFDFADRDLVSLTTRFTVMDKSQDPNTEVETYTQTSIGGGVDSVTSGTNDTWGIAKKFISATPSDDKQTVTVRFEIAAGLEADDGSIITDPNTYERYGRVPFASVTLTEDLSVTNREEEELTPTSITVIPQFDENPIDFTGKENQKIKVPVDSCAGQVSGGKVADSAPFYSKYYVDAVYPYEDFIADYSDDNQAPLTVNNTATLDYTLKGGSLATANASASGQVGEVTQPAALTIRKYIRDYQTGTDKLYVGSGWDPVSGSAVFKIQTESQTAPTLYTKKANGTYEKITTVDGRLVITPQGTASGSVGTDGTITVYLDAGTYTVTEETTPTNTVKVTSTEDSDNNAENKTLTLSAGESLTADFYNKEVLNAITVKKTGTKDGTTSALAGAEFGLYSDSSCAEGKMIEKKSTDSQGQIVFDRLAPGTYYVKEIGAPEGYILDAKVSTAKVTADGDTVAITSDNVYNSAYVTLQKQYFYFTGGDYKDVDNSNYTDFNSCFTLQQKTEDGQWENVVLNGQSLTGLSLTTEGTWTSEALPVYDSDGNVITYRFREVLPKGWHAGTGFTETTEDEDRVIYSDEFDLVDVQGESQSGAKQITMKNNRNGSFTLTKKFYNAMPTGMVEVQGQDVEFKLYQQEGENGEIREYSPGTYTIQIGGTLTVKDLPRTSTDGNTYYYYWVETGDTGDYKLADTKTIQVGGQALQALGPYNFVTGDSTGTINLEQAITAENIQQKVPVVVKKISTETNQFVSGAAYTVYRKGTDGTETEIAKNVSITSASGSLQLLDPGYEYRFEETTVPQGYQDVTVEDSLTLDLTNVAPVDKNTKVRTITLKNQPDPVITVSKTRMNANGGTSALTDVEFEIYQKDGENNFVRVKGYDNTTELSVTAGSKVQLPAGTYYLREVVPADNPNQILDPDKYPDLYTDKKETDTEGKVYFGPYKVTEENTTWDLGTIQNYSALGAATVTKKAADSGNGLKGAVLRIYRKGEDGAEIQVGANGTAYEVTTEANGQASFTNLPIYDENGDQYTYYVREVSAPDGYYVSETELRFQLETGKTVMTGLDSKALEIIDQPLTSLTIQKEYYNIWEHQFTSKTYRLPGTVIALYRWDEDTDVYDFVKTGTTDSTGTVTFDGLTQEDEYAAVEVRVPDDAAYEYLEPETGEYLYADYQEGTDTLPPKISKTEMDQYYFVTKEANTSGTPANPKTETMYNEEHWAQLNVFKYVVKGDDDTKTPVNNAKFTVYQQIVEDGKTELSFNAANCTEIGSYSSGTLYNTEGIRQDGWFASDILKAKENVVYWLVETKPGPGTEIIPANQYILVKMNGTAYTNNTQNGEGITCTGTAEYVKDTIVQVEVKNAPTEGPGEARYASVRIAKWAGSYDSDGQRTDEYTPLGNAKFDLWLADKGGNLIEKLDVLTVGLDNPEGTYPDKLTAWAASESFSYETMQETYGELNDGDEDIIWMDNDIGYVRVALVESSTPGGYLADNDTYYMLMCFAPPEEGEGFSETFNDAYYIKDKTEKVDLASEQEGIVWAVDANDEKGNSITSVSEVNPDERYRLVNWPTDHYSVSLHKYGYQVTDKTMKKTSSELDAYYAEGNPGRTALSGVQMKLQRYNSTTNTWQDYNYKTLTYTTTAADATFTTGAGGSYSFPSGLNVGRYRIIELKGDPDYENIYTGGNLTGGSDIRTQAAMYFNVLNSNVNLSMYNPAKLSLEIKKTETDGTTPVANATFTLTSGSTKVTGTTDEYGTVTLTGIGTGTWKLTESASGYSSAYLSKYLGTKYPQLAALTGNGLSLGYATALADGANGLPEVTVKSMTDFTKYGLTGTAALEIENPELVSLTVTKADAQDSTTLLSGATFKVEYQAFTETEGEVQAGTSWTTVEEAIQTLANGSFTLTGRQPGIYRITETAAPSGYEMIDGETVKLVAITGGLGITKVTDAEGNEIQISNDSASASFIVNNRKLTTLNVSKELTGLKLPEGTEKTFTFKLYDSTEATTAVRTASATVNADGTDTKAEFTGLSQGKTYYLEESDYDTDEFALTGAKASDGTALTEVSGGSGNSKRLFKVTIPADGTSAEVTVTNQYLYAEFCLLKVDGDTGAPLSGATFEVYRVNNPGTGDEQETKLTADEITWLSQGTDGKYQARVRLSANGEETFRIKEIQAPEGYLLQEEDAEVPLSPGDSECYGAWDSGKKDEELLNDLIFPNRRGADFTLTKYDNVREGENSGTLSGVTFHIYNQTASGWVYLREAVTDSDGKISLTLPGGSVYAVTETQVPSGYTGLESVWEAGDAGKELSTVELGSGVTLYVLNEGQNLTPGAKYEYLAYNEPYLELEVRKMDAGGAGIVPKAEFSVYEVPNGTKEELTQSELETLMKPENLLVGGVKTSKSGSGFTYADKSVSDALGRVVSGKTYLVVETSVEGPDAGTDYDSIIKDDNRVEWYQVHAIPEGAEGEQVVTLENVLGQADVSLEKTTQTAAISGSLMESGQEVSYTLKPGVDDNSYALDSFVLTDIGLTAYHSDTELNFDEYLKNKYSVQEVKLETSSHDISHYELTNAPAAGVIYATVRFLGFDGSELYQEKVMISDSAKTVVLPDGKGKAAKVEISYESEGLKQETGYALGQNFKPGDVEISIALDKQEGGENVQAIDRIRNDAKAEIAYRKWDSQGVQDTIPVTDQAEDHAENTFGDMESAVVSVTKTAENSSVLIGNDLSYTITVSNAQSAGAPMINPILVDLLPQGAALGDISLNTTGNDSGLTLSHSRTETDGDNTAALVFLNGKLKPGDSVSVDVEITASSSVVRYGNILFNNAFVTSDYRGVQSADNPAAASFRNANGNWAEPLTLVGTGLGPTRLASLTNMLGNIANYGYITASAIVEWNSASNLAIVKSGYGDLDADAGRTYSSSRVATASNDGYVQYRLAVSNSSGTEGAADLTLVDVIPTEGDRVSGGTDRHSQWPLNFDGITSVYKVEADGAEETISEANYELYYYTGELTTQENYTSVYGAVKDAQNGCPTGWSETAEPKAVTAFIIALDDSVYLGNNESLMVEYKTKVDNYEAEELSEISYLNTVNSFATYYSYYPLTGGTPENATPADSIIGSNSVSATIQPEPVKVGGHVWIDVDQDGVWESGESISDLSSYSIIQDLMDKIEIRLFTYNDTTDQSMQTTDYNKTGNWMTDANYVFEDLYSGMLQTGVTEAEAYDGDNHLIVGKLKGANPYTYRIAATIPETVTGNFGFTSEGTTNGISRNPAGGIPTEETTDSNFSTQSATAGASERFYLWPTDITTTWDNTKDVGLVLNRDLKITKTAKDDPTERIEGAEFKVYGPFDADAGASADLTGLTPVARGTTGADGTLTFEDLLWFKEYVVVETNSAQGYEIDGAEGSGTNIEKIAGKDGAWLLKVPETTSTVTEDTMTVTNTRETEVSLQASKKLTGRNLQTGEFKFQLLSSDGTTVLQDNVSNDADGSVTFAPVKLEGEGSHTFYIKEQIPAGGTKDGVTYDQTTYRAVVTTAWNDTDKKLEVTSVQYFKGTSQIPETGGAEFTNIYDASGSWTPEGTKTLTGRDMKAGETYSFLVTENGKTVSTGTASGGADGRAVSIGFTQISYTLEDVGEHNYTITETSGAAGNGVTYDTTSYTVKVTVADAGDGTLTVTPEYPAGGVMFTNRYTPNPVTYAPMVKKTLTGHVLPEQTKSFAFTLEKKAFSPDGGASLPADTNLTLTVNGMQLPSAAQGTFGDITFSKAGTYTFTIKETVGSEAGYTYDSAEWTLEVVVADDGNGTLTITSHTYSSNASGAQSNTSSANFVNSYQPGPATVNLNVSKAVTGDPMPQRETFTFTQSYGGQDAAADGITMPANNTETITISQTGEDQRTTAAFDTITFTKAGIYYFLIREDTQNLPAGYDKNISATRRARVTVKDINGQLTVTETLYYLTDPSNPDTGNAANFTNRYDTDDTVFTPIVKKTLTGDILPGSKTFTFEIERADDKEGVTMPSNTTTSVTYQKRIGDATASFGEITFTKAGTYQFTITEQQTADAGYTCDTSSWNLKVTVVDQGGKLAVDGHTYSKPGETGNEEAAQFTNTYRVTPTEYLPQVKKSMAQGGSARPSEQTFAFTMTAEDTNPAGGAVIANDDVTASVTVPAGAETGIQISPTTDPFGKITFSKAGTYLFTIRETAGSQTGYTYDGSIWTLTVVVEDRNSQLQVVSHTYTKTGASGNEAAAFINDYHAAPTAYTPAVEKAMTGENRVAQETFRFKLTADSTNPADGAVIAQNGGETSVTLQPQDTKKTAEFGAITFSKAGTYVFRIAEEDEGTYGYTYDTAPWTLTVVVEDQNGNLNVVSHTYERTGDTDRHDHALITNRYQVDPITYEPQVKKTVTGDVPQGRDETFTFRLERTDAVPADGSDLAIGEVKETKVQGNGTNAFEEITFTRAGTYEFQITEVNDKTPGYSYDGNIWTLTVKVTDQGGKLAIESTSYVQQAPGTLTSSEQAEFTNVYSTTETAYTPKISKEITGDRTSKDVEFAFTLQADAGNPAGASVTGSDALQTSVTGEGEAVFAPITFSKAGTYQFTISEIQGTEAGYTYDAEPWTLTVTVEDRGSILTVTDTVYSRSGQADSEEMAEFVNTYEVSPTEYIPTVEKRITGDLPEGKEDVFRFQITEKEGNPEGAVLPGQTEAEVSGSGTASFEKILFEQAGTYQFELIEINDGTAGYQYDGSVWTLTVTVIDTNGVLSVENAAYTKAGETQAGATAVFENHYNPKEAAYTPRVVKKLTGDQPLEAAEFNFVLQADASNPEGAVMTGTSASVTGAGMTSFAPITFTKAGTYEFDIREVDGKEAGYTYDEYIWKLIIEVKDAGGILTVADVKYQKIGTFISNNEAAEFTNEYKLAVATGGNVKTGDQANIPGAMAGLGISALFILILMYRRRREEKRH